MDKEEIIKGNELIALFMDWKFREPDKLNPNGVWEMSKKYHFNLSYNLHFNEDWGLLMDVVEKVKELKYPIYLYQSHIQNTVEIFELGKDHYIIRESDTKSKPIEILWKALVSFIEMYNEESKESK